MYCNFNFDIPDIGLQYLQYWLNVLRVMGEVGQGVRTCLGGFTCVLQTDFLVLIDFACLFISCLIFYKYLSYWNDLRYLFGYKTEFFPSKQSQRSRSIL